MKSGFTIILLLLLASNLTLAQRNHRYDVGIGRGEIEFWHLSGHYQLYPSGRIGVNLGLIREFNAILMAPWYGVQRVNHTSFSVEHLYFFKTKTKRVTPFYFRQGVTYAEQKFSGTEHNQQGLYTTLALGIALDMKKHWGLSLDVGVAPVWWGRSNGRNVYTDSDVTERYPFFQPEIRLQAYYWR